MSWVKLDDRFPTHPKVIALSDRAFRVHVEGLCYCAEHQTDGFVPHKATNSRGAGELHRAGLWHPTEGGWTIHDYLDFNPSRQEWQELSQKRSKAGSKGAAKRWQDDSKAIAVPEPVPETPKTRSNTAAAPSSNNPHQPTDRQMYFADRLELTPAAVVKLNKQYGKEFVLSAMEQVHGFPPAEGIANAYAYVSSVASFKKAGAA